MSRYECAIDRSADVQKTMTSCDLVDWRVYFLSKRTASEKIVQGVKKRKKYFRRCWIIRVFYDPFPGLADQYAQAKDLRGRCFIAPLLRVHSLFCPLFIATGKIFCSLLRHTDHYSNHANTTGGPFQSNVFSNIPSPKRYPGIFNTSILILFKAVFFFSPKDFPIKIIENFN